MRNYFLAAEAPELKPGLKWCRLSLWPVHSTPGKYLFGSEQADTSLLGLAGEDHIYGGAGNDTINGQAGETTPSTTLPIGHRTSSGSNSVSFTITVHNWQEGQIGTSLGTNVRAQLQNKLNLGDQHAPTGNRTINMPGGQCQTRQGYDWATTSWAADGSLSGGIAQADFNKVSIRSVSADTIHNGNELSVPNRLGPDDRFMDNNLGCLVAFRRSNWGAYNYSSGYIARGEHSWRNSKNRSCRKRFAQQRRRQGYSWTGLALGVQALQADNSNVTQAYYIFNSCLRSIHKR